MPTIVHRVIRRCAVSIAKDDDGVNRVACIGENGGSEPPQRETAGASSAARDGAAADSSLCFRTKSDSYVRPGSSRHIWREDRPSTVAAMRTVKFLVVLQSYTGPFKTNGIVLMPPCLFIS
jgi:hypothetical protein